MSKPKYSSEFKIMIAEAYLNGEGGFQCIANKYGVGVASVHKKAIAELLDITASLKKLNAELDGKRKKALKDYYEAATKLEDAQGIIVKLTAQINHDYENSFLPSSKCINRKKITNNREKTGKKPDKVLAVPTGERLKDSSRYIPTGNTISRQVIGIMVVPMVTEYRTEEFYDKKKGRNAFTVMALTIRSVWCT